MYSLEWRSPEGENSKLYETRVNLITAISEITVIGGNGRGEGLRLGCGCISPDRSIRVELSDVILKLLYRHSAAALADAGLVVNNHSYYR